MFRVCAQNHHCVCVQQAASHQLQQQSSGMEHQQQAWPGFSPGPASVSMSPGPGFEFSNNMFGSNEDGQPESPLVFMRTPVATVQDTTCPDSSKRFTNWMDSTSPYTARKTPPTASMKSMAAGDENTPPGHEMARVMSEKGSSFGSQQHFQAWLRATNSTSWTPRKSPAAGTPPPAPAPSPAATPMSIMRDLQHSAATPPNTGYMHGEGQRQRGPSAAAAVHNGFDTSDDGEDDAGEASTTIGAAQLAAAADRAAAASRMAGMLGHSSSSSHGSNQQQARQLSTPPRVPAPSPALTSPAAPGLQQHQQAVFLQAAADRIVQDSLSTPMSQLNIGRRPGARGEVLAAPGAVTPDMLVGRSISRATASGLPASPAEKLIGLMLSPKAEGRTRHHHHHHQQQQQQLLTPSRLSAAVGGGGLSAEAPLSPNLQVIDLMMHADSVSDSATQLQEQQHAAAEYRPEAAARAGQDAASDASDRGSDSSSKYGSACESDDEMDLSELQALCGEGVGPDTPLSVILGMLKGTPQVAGLTPGMGGPEQQQGALNDDIGPRVLFTDD